MLNFKVNKRVIVALLLTLLLGSACAVLGVVFYNKVYGAPEPGAIIITAHISPTDGGYFTNYYGTQFSDGTKDSVQEESRTDIFTAYPNSGYKFFKWGGGSTENPLEKACASDLYNADVGQYICYFVTEDKVIIAVNTDDETKGTVSESVAVDAGDSVTIVATPAEDYEFMGWQNESGEIVSRDATYTFNASSDIRLTAIFATASTITVTTADETQGAVSGGGTVLPGNSVSVYAYPYPGYRFVNWTNSSGSVLSSEVNYTFSPLEDMTIQANFTRYDFIHNSDTNITNFTYSFDKTNMTMKLIIFPDSGEYINQISFDGVVYYPVDSWRASIYGACSFALYTEYYVTTGTNALGFIFDLMIPCSNYDIYVTTTNEPYTSLDTPSLGSMSGVAVSATKGGVVSLVGDDFENLSDSDTITYMAKLSQNGYGFDHWEDDEGNILGTNMNLVLTKNEAYNTKVIAVFAPIDKLHQNSQIDNSNG